jgi:ADP-ribose pyrophosphatase YjhB (NUDIX family)
VPQFCSACGAHIGRRAPAACDACGAEHWPKMNSAAGALIVRGGKLLLLRRALEPWRGAWCAPGGFCDEGEGVAAAAIREAREEAGLEIEITGYLGQWVDEYTPAAAGGGDPSYCCVSYLHARVVGDAEPRVDGVEMDDYGWFAPDELPRPLAPTLHGEEIYAAWARSQES